MRYSGRHGWGLGQHSLWMFCQKTDGGGDTARSTASTSSCRSIPSSGSGVAGRQQRPLSGSKKTAVTAGSVSGRSSSSASSARASRYTHTHTHPFNGPFSGTTRVSRYQKVKPIWILLKQETVSGSSISWAICKFAPRSIQTTIPAPHHSVFYRPDALPAPNQQRQSTEGNSLKVLNI